MNKKKLQKEIKELTRIGVDTKTQSMLLIAEILFDIKEELAKDKPCEKCKLTANRRLSPC